MSDTDTVPNAAPSGQRPADKAPARSFLNQLELDLRLLGMVGAFILVCVVFKVLTEGRFLTPRNIYNL